jgi:hypothetical protein
MIFDGDKFYCKFVDLDEIYNFLVKMFFYLKSYLCSNNLNIVCIIWARRLFEMKISELQVIWSSYIF